MNEEKQLFERWISTLRSKASQYEHTARKNGETVTQLDLDTVCNEIEAYLIGKGINHSK